MADTPVLVTATLVASTVLGMIGQKVLRTNAREGIQKDLLLSEQKRHDECEKLLREYRDMAHDRNNKLMVDHQKELADQDRNHATELAELRKEMFAAAEKYDENCDRLRLERDEFRGKYMQLAAEVHARKSVFIGSIETWPADEKEKK